MEKAHISDKAALRKTIKACLAKLPPKEFTSAGISAARLLPGIPAWNDFRSVLAFFSMKDEIDTRPIMETALNAGKALFVPRIEGEDLVFFRIDQYCPAAADPAVNPVLNPLDFPALIITPGLAFDSGMNRLGRGRSYYDRFYASLAAAGRNYTALGLCMDCQLVDIVPVEPWDKKMDALLTGSHFQSR